ncbi:uncharacterized protein G2W53_007594 [Senna tora]|uniref:Uncharacterized protein n=1 Tax=Senna tora TaxID=362788 RepID=A0A834X797_9FABA|nr:uncharacterized protein G2W53_007594 [Senna tora]
MACKACQVMCKHILNRKSRLNLNRIHEVQVKLIVAQMIQIDRFALYLGILVDLRIELDS